MPILKCKMCGGDVQPSDNTYGTCDSCGVVSSLPKVNDERIANIFNRANHLRLLGEFDKALASYESVIAEDPTNAEAHWCAALCRFGITYVSDPDTSALVPTCHRMQYETILSDVDYQLAIKHSPDENTRSLYQEEALKISDIQKRILTISKQVEPYDVFICVKETTEGGSRTKDSVLAQDIYYHLKKEGLKVFLARITLEDKLGEEYEPYIFSALNSAKVMIVVGTTVDHFNATWVKNEWSRFYAIMKKDRTRTIIPCYKDMNPYDMPEELAILQSLDMSKLGFMQDLMRGVKKVLEKRESASSIAETTKSSNNSTLERMVQKTETYLKLYNYPEAKEVFTQITKDYPEDYRGWWGLMICETKNWTVISEEYDTLKTLYGYVKKLISVNELESLEQIYLKYLRMKAEIDTRKEIANIKEIINTLTINLSKNQNNLETLELQKTSNESKNIDNITKINQFIEDDNKQLSEWNMKKEKINKNENRGCLPGVVGFLIMVIPFYFVSLVPDDKVDLFFIIPGFGLFLLLASILYWLICHFVTKTPLITMDTCIKNINTIKTNLNNLKKDLNNERMKYQDQQNKLIKAIKGTEIDIDKTQKRLSACKEFISKDISDIIEYNFAKLSIFNGIPRHIDKEIISLYSRIAGKEDETDHVSTESETIPIKCPSCGAEVNADKNRIAVGKEFVCSVCGKTSNINIDAGNCHQCGQPLIMDFSGGLDKTVMSCPVCNYSVVYDFTSADMSVSEISGLCDHCHQRFTLSHEDLERNSCICPKCGKENKLE